MTYDDDMLQEINESVDLYEYVGQSIDLEKRGEHYFGHCPLHIDKTPSLCITPSKNMYYCFSCGSFQNQHFNKKTGTLSGSCP